MKHSNPRTLYKQTFNTHWLVTKVAGTASAEQGGCSVPNAYGHQTQLLVPGNPRHCFHLRVREGQQNTGKKEM